MSTQAHIQTKPATVRRLRIDVPLLLIVACLVVFGLLMVYSSSWDIAWLADKGPAHIFTKQIVWVFVGTLLATAASYFDYHRIPKLVVPMMFMLWILLLAVLVINRFEFGAIRGLVGGSVQPAEFAKMGIVLYLAVWLNNRQEIDSNFKFGLLSLIAVVGVVAILIGLQPDFSAAGTIFLLGIMMFFIGGGDLRQLFIPFGIAAGALIFAINFVETVKVRVDEYLSLIRNPKEGSFHILRTYEAVIKGRLFGVGIGNANTKFTGLPLPHTDSIFAVIAEETGLMGSFFVILLYVLLLWRGYVIPKKAPDTLGKLISFGLIGWIVFEALLNIAVIVGLFPMAGNALPFISAGGSSMISTLIAIGIVMNVARQGETKESLERSQGNATVDLRGRDWRRSVSRTNRYTEIE